MPYHIKDKETDRLIRELADARGTTIARAIRDAVERALEDNPKPPAPTPEKVPLRDWLAPIQMRYRSAPPHRLSTDKAFYDWLSGEER